MVSSRAPAVRKSFSPIYDLQGRVIRRLLEHGLRLMGLRIAAILIGLRQQAHAVSRRKGGPKLNVECGLSRYSVDVSSQLNLAYGGSNPIAFCRGTFGV